MEILFQFLKELKTNSKMRKDYPNPVQFAKGFLVMISPALLITVLIILLTGCKVIEPTYIVTNDVTVMEYNNRKGDLIIVPLNTNECVGYKKPYHIITYNN